MFRAFDARSDQLVAVKAFRLDVLPQHVERFVEALARLVSQPVHGASIVPAIDAGVEGSTPYLVMPHQSGDTLDVVIRRLAPANLAQALPLMATLAEAIDTAWAAGRGHGALHPRDIFLGTNNRASGITGFGVVQALQAAGIAAPLRRPYSAPERTDLQWGLAADVYSLGAIAHELLTKRRPAAGEQDGVFSAGLAANERVNARRALATALAERPDDRFTSAGEFVRALEGTPARKTVIFPSSTRLTLDTLTRGIEDWAAASETLPLFAASPKAAPDDTTPDDTSLGFWPAVGGEPQAAAGVPDDPDHETVAMPAAPSADALPHEAAFVPLVRADRPQSPVEIAESWLSSVQQDRPRRGWSWPLMGLAAALSLLVVGAALIYQAAREPSLDSGPPSEAALPESPDGSPGGATVPPAETEARELAQEPDDRTDAAQPRGVARARATGERRVAARGRLVIRSQPSGAMVTVDGRLLGDTPLTLDGVRLGTHALQVARPGYVPRVERVTLSAAIPERTLTVALEPALDSAVGPEASPGAGRRAADPLPAANGAVQVESTPRGARVLIDGRFVGQAPLRVPELTPGTHVVSFELAGYRPATRSVAVLPGKVARVVSELVEQ